MGEVFRASEGGEAGINVGDRRTETNPILGQDLPDLREPDVAWL